MSDLHNDLLQQFIEFMVNNDCAPKVETDIKPDNNQRYFAIEGDKGTRKSGSYCVKIDDDFGFGWFMSHRNGDLVKWSSRCKNDTRTPAEKAAWKAKIEAERTAQDLENERIANEAAQKSVETWEAAQDVGNHDYLKRKKINLNGARINGNNIIIPAYNADGKIRTIQTICGSGNKLFMTGGQKKGCYFHIGLIDQAEYIIICEGYATGCSLYEALKLPVIVAFDSGNLKPVLQALRKKYKNASFIIAADNDAWTLKNKFKPNGIDHKNIAADDQIWDEWRQAGHLTNVGLEKAQDAAGRLSDVRIVLPRFNDATKRFTDFNDLFVSDGADAIKKIFDEPVLQQLDNGAKPDAVPEWLEEIPWPDDEESRAVVSLYAANDKRLEVKDWKNKLHLTEKGYPVATSLNNTMLYIEHDPVLKNIFCYDEFTSKKVVYQCPPWGDPKTFSPRPIDDDDITFLTAYIEKFGLKISTANVSKCLRASVKKNPKNPAKEYFKGLQWDGVKRLDNWLRDYCECTTEDPEYISVVGRKWLCACVKRVFFPGAKFDHMLVLEGEQGTRKSTLLKELATIHGIAYFDDTIDIKSLGTFNAIMKFQGKLIVEIAELTGIHKKDVNELKNQITICDDNPTLKYENEPTLFPRQFVFAGTINPTVGGYLSDPTGNRRFLPVTTKFIDIDGLAKVKEQLWAEAYEAVMDGEKLYFNEEITKKAEIVALSRSLEHPWFADISKLVENSNEIEKEYIWNELGINDRTKRTPQAATEISKIMTKLGFDNKQIRYNGSRKYLWKRKEKKEAFDEIEF